MLTNPKRDRRRLSKPIFFKPIAPIVLMLLAITLTPCLWLGTRYLQRPARIAESSLLFSRAKYQRGAKYQRIIWNQPRPVVLHLVAIDLTSPNLKILVTPADRTIPDLDDRPLIARTTTDFLKTFNMDLAINGSFFFPFKENGPLDYSPHSGDRVNVVGQAISSGKIVSANLEDNWAMICFDARNRAQILNQSTCPAHTQQGLSGNELILQNGTALNTRTAQDGAKPYARSIVGLDATGDTLWLVVVDGKQPSYSEGATLPELAAFLPTIGIMTALNLDGGGSTALAYQTPQGAQILNAPIHTKIPMMERPVANHLGFRFAKSQ